MWPKEYKDYPVDSPLRKERVVPLKGIVGCEMNEVNGWGETFHEPRRKQNRGLLYTMLVALFSSKKES